MYITRYPMESARTFTLTLKEMCLLVAHATMAITDDDKERVLNWYANEVEEKMGVTREELEEVFDSLQLSLWPQQDEEEEKEEDDDRSVEEPCARCTHQTASMPNNYSEHGRLCADCYWEVDHDLKRRKFEHKGAQ